MDPWAAFFVGFFVGAVLMIVANRLDEGKRTPHPECGYLGGPVCPWPDRKCGACEYWRAL